MKQMYIKIGEIAKVYAFAELAQEVVGDIKVKRGIWCVSGKSALGLFALDMSDGVLVEYPEGAAAFENFISQFKV